MKKSNFLSLILICVIVASLIIYTKAICEDEDFAFDVLYKTNDSFRFDEFFASILSCSGILYEYRAIAIAPVSIMAYLERHEKSPPVNPPIFVTD